MEQTPRLGKSNYDHQRKGTDKLRVWEENTYTIKLKKKKDLLNRTGGSTEQTVITYMRKKTEK